MKASGPLGRVGFAEVDAQDVWVEKGGGVAGFFQGPKGVFVRLCEVIEEAADVVDARLARVAIAGEDDEVTGAVGEALARLGARRSSALTGNSGNLGRK